MRNKNISEQPQKLGEGTFRYPGDPETPGLLLHISPELGRKLKDSTIDFNHAAYINYLRNHSDLNDDEIKDLQLSIMIHKKGPRQLRSGSFNQKDGIVNIFIGGDKPNQIKNANRALLHETEHMIDSHNEDGYKPSYEKMLRIANRLRFIQPLGFFALSVAAIQLSLDKHERKANRAEKNYTGEDIITFAKGDK